jgi:hypothetical protein
VSRVRCQCSAIQHKGRGKIMPLIRPLSITGNRHGYKSVTAEITDAANGIVRVVQYDKQLRRFCFWLLLLHSLFFYNIPFDFMPTRSDVSTTRREGGVHRSVGCYCKLQYNCNSARLGYHSKNFQSFFQSCPAVRVTGSIVLSWYRISPKLKT